MKQAAVVACLAICPVADIVTPPKEQWAWLDSVALNNREIAIVVWAMLLFGAVALSSRARQAFYSLVRVFSTRLIMFPLAVTGFYVCLSVAVLAVPGLWGWANLKTTIIWIITFAFVTMLDISRISEDDSFFRKSVRDILSGTAIVVFIAEFYTFNLLAELILLPIGTLAAALQVMAKRNSEYATLGRLMGWVVGFVGFTYIANGIYQMIVDFKNFATFNTFQEFTVPLFLSFLFLPFIFLLTMYVVYKKAFARVQEAITDPVQRRYARRQAFLGFHGNFELVRRWARNIVHMRPKGHRDIARSIEKVKRLSRLENSPPPVPTEEGWSPYVAKNFLQDHGFVTSDYHEFEGEWFASSILPDNIAYYVEGDEHAAHRLKLKLNVNTPDAPAESELRFASIALGLATKAIGERSKEILGPRLGTDEEFELLVSERHVQLVRDNWTGGIRGGYSRIFTIDRSATYRSSDQSTQ